MMAPPADAMGIVDEAGFTGKVKNLAPERDDEIGLVAALMLPDGDLEKWEAEFRPPFEAFRASAPAGAKLHVTDAFASGDTAWAAVAAASRRDVFDRIQRLRLLVVYTARRAVVARTTHALMSEIRDRAQAASPPHITVSRRPSTTRHVAECFQGVVSVIDILAGSAGCGHVALYSDTIDATVLADMEAAADRLRRLSRRETEIRGFDKAAKLRLAGKISFSVDLPGIDVSRVGRLEPLGKSSALVFASDVVCNALLHHLEGLPRNLPLNTMRSVEGFALERQVFAPPSDMADIYNII